MPIALARCDDLLHRVYDSALAPACWPATLGAMFHLRDEARQVAASRAALNRLAAGVVLLDGEGFVQFANAAAEALLLRGDKVRRTAQEAMRLNRSSTPSRLAVASGLPGLRAAFTKAIAAAIRPYVDGGAAERFAEALVLPDEQGKPAFTCLHSRRRSATTKSSSSAVPSPTATAPSPRAATSTSAPAPAAAAPTFPDRTPAIAPLVAYRR
ncbi:MAG: hypothetical protein KGL43_01230 [Burkholderiales bacterium]|nr:hypothetical protein [Burkholderiales bacterium]MDE2452190.1 hypothetical protein [Burkholderiales bacterium]